LCPFIDKSDPRCAAHLNLGNVSHAYGYCADRYQMCLIYQELINDDRNSQREESTYHRAAS